MNPSDHSLATHSIRKLMLKFSIPCIIALLVSALYNIVDQIFIGWGLGYLGNGATNVVFPITVITLAVALLIGDGCAAFLSLCQGKKDSDSAHAGVGNAIALTVVSGVLLSAALLLFREPILWGFGATQNNIAYAREYYGVIVLGVPFYMFGSALNAVIRADGSPKFAMLSTLAGCLINIVLDPVAIFVLGWGMRGAALATIVGQIVSALLAVYYLRRAKTFRLKATSYRPSARLIKRFLPLGVSSLLTQVSIVLIMAVMNNTLVQYGAQSKYGADIPLTVVGIVMKVFQIVIAFSVGIAVGAQPILGYNYGAGLYGRVRQVFKTMLWAELGVGVLATLAFELFPLQIIGLFGSENSLYNEFAVLAFRIYLGSILLTVVQKSACIFLQALGKPVQSMALSLLREFVLCAPLIVLLPRAFGVTGALWAAPITDGVVLVAVVLMLRHTLRGLQKAPGGRLAATPAKQTA